MSVNASSSGRSQSSPKRTPPGAKAFHAFRFSGWILTYLDTGKWGDILVSGEVKLQPSVIWAMLVILTSVRTLHGSLCLPRPFILPALVSSCSIWILAWLMIPRDCSIIVVFQSHSFPCSKFTAVLHLPRGQSPGRWLLATFEIFELQKHRTWDQFSPACWHLLALVLSLGRCNLPFGQGMHQFQCHNRRGWKWQNLSGAATKYGYGSNLGRR